MSAQAAKTVIIGLDGVPHGLIRAYTDQGLMPHLKALVEEETFLPMTSSIPDVSSVAWSSIITGLNPGEHGIFGFTEIDRESYRYRFPNFKDLKAPPFWQNRKSAIINVPQTYPAAPMDGVLISGFVSPSFDKAVFPPELLPSLREMDYRTDVDSLKAQTSITHFLEEVEEALTGRMKCFDLLWEREDWEIFMFVFTETDRMHHFLFDAYQDKNHPHAVAFQDFYREIDRHIGTITQKLGENDTLIIHSDHGFCKLEQEVYLNHFLKEQGYLTFTSATPATITELDPEKTRAFCLDPGRIHIHTREKFPGGTVSGEEAEFIRRELTELFDSLEFEGRKVIQRIYRNEEVFHGPHAGLGPDLVLLGHRGFDLKGVVQVDQPYGRRAFTGMHTQDDAFIIYRGPENNLANPFHIEKIAPLV